MSQVGDAIGGATDFLVGGKPEYHENKAFGAKTPEEAKRLQDIESKINELFGQQSQAGSSNQAASQQLASMFQDNLKSFLAGGSQNPNPSPEQLQQASQFVDQTFTNPAQNQLKQQLNDLQSNYAASAASMGRNPNLDIASQQAFASDASKAGLGLQAERGARIQQEATRLNDQNYNRGLQGLNVGMQGSGFLNGLGQQAFTNRMGLLNARSGLADIYQRDRANQGTQTNFSSGLLTNLNSIQNGIGNVAMGGSNNASMVQGLVGKAGSLGGFL